MNYRSTYDDENTQSNLTHSLIFVAEKTIPLPVESRRGSNAVRKHHTHVANVDGGLVSSSNENMGNDFQFRDRNDVKVYQKKSYIDINMTLESKSVLSEAKIVLIIAYMRTGSTLAGAIFQSYAGTFYVFEPIRKLNDFFRDIEQNENKQGILKFANGTQRYVHKQKYAHRDYQRVDYNYMTDPT